MFFVDLIVSLFICCVLENLNARSTNTNSKSLQFYRKYKYLYLTTVQGTFEMTTPLGLSTSCTVFLQWFLLVQWKHQCVLVASNILTQSHFSIMFVTLFVFYHHRYYCCMRLITHAIRNMSVLIPNLTINLPCYIISYTYVKYSCNVNCTNMTL